MSDTASDILSALKKRMPKHTFGLRSEDESWFLPTGSLILDMCIRDGKMPSGLPGGRLVEFYGQPSCLAEDTHIPYHIYDLGGRRVNTKGGSIARLYERFHGLPPSGDGRGKARSNQVGKGTFTVPCADEEGMIGHSPIENVVFSGIKPCFEVSTEGGRVIRATLDHRFLTPGGYSPLRDLAVGDAVFAHPGKRTGWGHKPRINRAYVYVQQHPVAGIKVVRAVVNRSTGEIKDYSYRRLLRSRFVMEAMLNGISQEDYHRILQSCDSSLLEGLQFIPREVHVHHLDGDALNDTPGNLCLMDPSDHGREHVGEHLGWGKAPMVADRIRSVTPIGHRPTYDIQMPGPNHNFVAEGLVVHNSGKTALALRCCRETQALGGMVIWLDAERGFEPSLARICGVDLSEEKFIFVEPYGLEHVLGAIEEIAEKYHDSPLPITVVVDSVSGLNPMAYMMDDSTVKDVPPAAATAKELHRWFRRGALWYASGSKITVIFISHLTADPRPYGRDVTPHGSAIAFYARLRLRMSSSDLKDPEGGKRLGQWLTTRIVKNKLGSKYAEAEMPFYFHSGFNPATENICYLIGQKALEKTANGRVVFNDKAYLVGQLRDLYAKDVHVREVLEQMVRDTFRADLETRRK